MSENRNISASQVKTFSKCPLSYWFSYLSDHEETKSDSDYLRMGSRVHEAIEAIVGGEREPPWHDEQAFRTVLQDEYVELDSYPIDDGDIYEDGLKCCRKAAKYLVDRGPIVTDVEHRVEFDISDGAIETGVTAIMDAITPEEVWDWKTGRIRDSTAHEEKIQGAIYMAAFYYSFDREPEAVRFVYLKEGKIRTLDPTDENWEYMKGHARALLDARESGEFPGRPGDQCYWCGHEFWCPEAPTGVGDVPWEEY